MLPETPQPRAEDRRTGNTEATRGQAAVVRNLP